MNRCTKTIVVAAIILALFQSVDYAYSFDADVTDIVKPGYTYITHTSTILSAQGEISAHVFGAQSMTHGTIRTTLRRRSLLWWSSVQTWERNFNGNTGILSAIAALGSGNRY